MESLSAYGRVALENQCARVRNTPVGGRNETLASAAVTIGRLVPHAIPEDVAWDHLTDAASDTGLPLRESKATIRTGLSKGRGNPRELRNPRKHVPAEAEPPTSELVGLFRERLGSRVINGAIAQLEIDTAWTLAPIPEPSMQREVVQSWDYLSEHVDIQFVTEFARAIRAVALNKHPDADLGYAVAVLKLKIQRSIKEWEKSNAE
jgi:hypothetical protein